MPLGSFAEVLSSVAALLWPLIVLVVLVVVLPELRRVLSSRDFTIEVAGMKLSAQAASDQLAKQVEDLQARLVELEGAPHASGSSQARAGDEPGPTTVRVALSEAADRPRVLWVDDEPQNNAYEVQSFQNQGWEVFRARSTEEALARRRRYGAVDAIISDLGRREDGEYNANAGLDLLREVRAQDPAVPFLIYTSEEAAARKGGELREAGADAVTASPVILSREAGRALSLVLERRIDSTLKRHGFIQEESDSSWLDFVGDLDGHRLGVEALHGTRETMGDRVRDRVGRAFQARRELRLELVLLVTSMQVAVSGFDETASGVRVVSVDALDAILDELT